MDKFLALIADAAEKLGVQAARIWPQVVAIHWLKSLLGAVLIPLALVGFSIVLVKFFKRLCVPMPPYGCGDDKEFGIRLGMGLVGGVGAFVSLLFFLIEWATLLAGVFWPEASLVLKTISK